MKLYFDIGASNTRIGVSDIEGNLGQTRIFPTAENFDDFSGEFKKAVDEITAGEQPEAAGGGFAGPLNRDKSGILTSYHADWIGRPIRDEFQRLLGCPVVLENDAALAALGEARLGSGKGYGIVAYFTFSTGLGGARIVDGKIDRNAWGFEPRWQALGFEGDTPIFLDDLISGNALKKRFNLKPEEISDRKAWEEIEKLMAICMMNAIGFWSPDVIIIGGGIGESHFISLQNLKQRVSQFMDYPVDVPFLKASLGQLNGLHGAKMMLDDLENPI